MAQAQGKLFLWVAALTLSIAESTAAGDEAWWHPNRKHVAKLTDFGGVGDGVTSNTAAFAAAVANLSQVAGDGGAMLVVPAGRWLTGPFNLTSTFTLFLERDAVILATQNLDEWTTIAPLPSYGRGRDLPGPRYTNFIMGYNLTDVVITGNNGSINGQGQVWWDKFRGEELKYTRGYLVEFMFCSYVVVSNVVLIDSPSWNLHPVYCDHVAVAGITILAPIRSPNTDGIDPDSSEYVWIVNSNVVSGDDCIAIKSGWDQYGIAFNKPSQHIYISNFSCVSPTSATIALGSEMSGGISDVHATNIVAVDTESALRLKTGIGRGGFMRDVIVEGMRLTNMKYLLWMTANYGQHPDDKFDPNAIPVVKTISFSNVVATNVSIAGKLEGLPQSPFTNLLVSDVTAEIFVNKKPVWNCTFVEGRSYNVTPTPCAELQH
ncbi:hypothetical protein ZIOFF_026065 [Zingiber officinale]|uniref:Polygalacturonase n=1 Tax=Zingiber officinale TaxID=94328 RepID=A0A8J5H2A8_ZINOF|nr:hypothetical protein ZIOFF_026065 [Zingiber officinale]